MGFITPYALFLSQGETKADDSSNKDASEEKQEEDSDYHRSDEQVGDRRESLNAVTDRSALGTCPWGVFSFKKEKVREGKKVETLNC